MSRYVEKRGWSTGKTIALLLLLAYSAVIYFTAIEPAMKQPAPTTKPAELNQPLASPSPSASPSNKKASNTGKEAPKAAEIPKMISPITGKPTR